jgi:hypothetical protein
MCLMGSLCFAQTPPAADSGQATPAAEAKPAAAAPAADAKPEAAAPAAAAAPAPGADKFDATAAILMFDVVPYADGSQIPPEVRQECTALGRQLADSTEKYGKENGLKLVRSGAVDPAKGGQVLVLRIVSVVSSRTMMAHAKSVAIRAELYKEGKLLRDYSPSRNSGGGVFGAYTSSCGVLERTVNTLGSDVAKWMKNVR